MDTLRPPFIMKIVFVWIFIILKYVSSKEDVACTSKDIRNDVDNLRELENCTTIEGYLHITLIERGVEADFEKYQFPKLVEISGHLLLYRVSGLKTLRRIFPNLAVIRGQELFHNYALTAYEMQDLEELGLVSLTAIKRGAVRLEKNSKLCYVDTIDWAKLIDSKEPKDNVFIENKDEQECVNICPDSCERSKVDGKLAKRCWSSSDCQKGMSCASKCGAGNFCNSVNGECCDGYCIGGCTGPSKADCLACKEVLYKNQCEPRCGPGTYKYMERRCLEDKQCINMERRIGKEEWKILRRQAGQEGECVEECPKGFTKNDSSGISECSRCSAHCPKVCTGRVIDSIDSAQTLKGCTTITGPLEIEVDGGSHIVMELEESLGYVEEVTHYIKVTRSYPILSLHFFKNLKVIRGEKLDQSHYSLNIFDNPNLQELFTPEVSKNLKIINGQAKFNFNRKLCFHKIKEFLKNVGLYKEGSEMADVESTNGDSIPCEVTKINLSVINLTPDFAHLQWEKFKGQDERKLLSYVVHYREVKSKNINIFQGRDACSESVWKTKEVEAEKSGPPQEVLTNLTPWTLYAAYIQTYTIGGASKTAISNVTYFRTLATNPTGPVNLQVDAEIEGELHVRWKPPKFPNGNVTFYKVYWQRQMLKREEFDKRDYCKEPLDIDDDKKVSRANAEEPKKNITLPTGDQCCRCPKSRKELEEEERIRLNEIAFENALHDTVYQKRPSSEIRKKREVPTQADIENGKEKYMKYDVRDGTQVLDKMVLNGTNNTNPDNETIENERKEIIVRYATEVILPNLGHSQPYYVEILACLDEKKNGQDMCTDIGNSAIANARTLPSPTADTINSTSITSRNINKTVVFINWESPVAPNGLIITFEVEYQKISMNDEYRTRLCINYTKYRAYKGYKLEKLSPGNYSYQIRATSLAGNGSWTPKRYFFIPSTGIVSSISKSVIAGICVGVFIILILTILIVWFAAKNKFAKDPEMTIVSHNPNYLPSEDVYIPDEWEVDRDKIKLLKEIGEGSFGMVWEGLTSDTCIPPYKENIAVAVKTVNDHAGVQDKMNFLKEASIMKAFSCHHVVKLLGVVSKGQPALVIMELMKQGDLKNYLRCHRPDVEENEGKQPPTLKEILQMAGEIADGMAYLADKKFVHRDLAARNCMVAEDNTVKIGDFGMTRDIYMTDYYRKGGKGLLPVRWMAPESLKDGIFTTMSDVWSYGVVLWEMATLAAQPYQGLSNEEVLKYVSDGKFMEKPEGCPDKLYELMLQCWCYRDRQRPTFKQIIEMLVPDLNPNFELVSYFFSDENKPDGPEFNDIEENDLENIDIDTYDGDMDDQSDYNLHDESTIPFIEHDLHNTELNKSPSRTIRASTSGPCECVMLEEMGDLPNGHRTSNCSSPNSAIGNSDGSKESSKSSDGSYTQRNGMPNGHIHFRLPHTTQC
ncbi:putative molluscan insulin-related peptide(s) receptor [Patella vulgata]|uniref:putative molluscan insulin-related peptide(s) receptor n=1 Tax=Patella vulgata TaxID=6465 RepID=UPI0024A8718F|nr:putative molluscan insulin-related peptide(s) receptor [Patella vulgata]